jgi:DNA helicase IV
MLSYDPLNDKSKAIAAIKNKKNDNIIYLSDEEFNLSKRLKDYDDDYSERDEEEDEYGKNRRINITNPNQRISIMPSIEGSDRIYISGPTECGKTTIIANYLKYFIKLLPDKSIYLFSDLKSDPVLDEFKEIKRVMIDEEFINNPITVDDLHNALLIFDDIDSIKNKKVSQAIIDLRDDCLKRGRHNDIRHIITTSHLSCEGKNTKHPLQEATHIIFFHSPNLNHLLKTYVGLSGKQIPFIKQLRSRWVCAKITSPQIIITENQVFFLNDI